MTRSALLVVDGRTVAATEVATSRRDRRRGLLARASVEGALVLERTRSVHTVGMRFPIDVALISGDGTVLAVSQVTPWRVVLPRSGTVSVVEARMGAFERWALRPGSVVEIREPTQERRRDRRTGR